jgi:hypothetical protein
MVLKESLYTDNAEVFGNKNLVFVSFYFVSTQKG